ncbi:MAG: hypothetical protein GY838_11905 [bacterium]|nr:hypothetical protein [bacterium]
MLNHRRFMSLLLALGAFALLAGCSNEGSDPLATGPTGDDYDSLDFSDEFGGLTASDEDEAFGEDALKALLLAEENEEVADPLCDDAQVRAWERLGNLPANAHDPARPHFTYVRLRWGMLRGPEDTLAVEPPCGATDWTGVIRADRGTVVVKRLIRFERPLDHVIWPRLDRQTVALVSHTYCGFDGIVLQIIEPPLATGQEAPETPNKLHIDMPLYSAEFNVADLADLDEVTPVDDLGNAFQITGFGLTDIDYCPKGFLSGAWRMLPDTAVAVVDSCDGCGIRMGKWLGAWTDLTGRLKGFMRGGYGVNAEGERVFVGKAIGRGGRFHALIRGTWEPAGAENELATFQGEWVLAGGSVDGLLGGEAHPVEGYPGGFYVGRWTTLCDDEAAEKVR